ncbi:MAG TPA: NPCBM/NEW2 domain-containing protein [Pirellulaceae bacterium]|nr:NPCBM/NEW2 domain-containing protein [Pirellulaceae bacterium]
MVALAFLPTRASAQEISPAPDFLLRTTDGALPPPARLHGIEADGYRFLTGPGVAEAIFPDANAEGVDERTVRDDQLIRFGRGVERPRLPLVSLVDGSVLAGELVSLGREALLLDSQLYGELSLPLGLIRGIALRPPYDPAARDALLDRIARYDGSDDALELTDGPTALGVWSPGASTDVRPSGPVPFGTRLDRFFVETASAEQPLEYSRERVRALFIAPAARSGVADDAKAFAWWGFRDGTLLRVVDRTPGEETVRAAIACGLELTLELDQVLEDLVLIESVGPHAWPASRLEPQAYRHTPLTGRDLPLGIDASSIVGRLRVGGGYVATGIGMHSRSRVVFAFDRAYRRFQAELAVEDAAASIEGRTLGSVVGAVYLLKEGAWSRAVETPVVRGGGTSAPVNVDVAGAQALMLVVEEADGADVLDRAAWLDARLVP